MSKNIEILSDELYSILSKYKILDFTHCLTRLRIKFDNSFPSAEEIKKIDGVLGVVQANNEMQIILGTSVVGDVYKCLSEKINNLSTNNLPNSANSNMTNFNKDKYRQNRLSQIMQKFAKIFSPLIPALVGAGIIGGVASIINIYGRNNVVAME
jgi:phosphotransferase system IIB component